MSGNEKKGWERDGLNDRREVVMVKRQVSKMEERVEEKKVEEEKEEEEGNNR